ncbi:cytochrome c biogenesis CcdA family protein [Lolliginicoccus levis]|uniref:cytochrome c biogenesis CcdA family protein n=1 Tax=Lolliginicoccus levis TaxID=2919542 RepID=UPI00241DB2FA|nr:cytochrome c biogenesis CcdA family protein [Lolliginicoccus levis]
MTTVLLAASIGDTFRDTAVAGPMLAAIVVAVLAGFVSFASPCVIPLVPGYLSYLAGLVGAEAPPTTVQQAQGTTTLTTIRDRTRWRVAGAVALFVAGFTVVFVLATASVFGMIGALSLNRELLQRVGGVVTILMGLVFIGLIPALQREARFSPRRFTSLLGAPVLGGIFGLGWTPCLGPTLAGVISLAAGTEGTTATRGVILIIAYCLGLGLPFVILAFGSTAALRGVGWLRRNARLIQVLGGLMLIAVGIALVTGGWELFVGWARDAFITDTVLPI